MIDYDNNNKVTSIKRQKYVPLVKFIKGIAYLKTIILTKQSVT